MKKILVFPLLFFYLSASSQKNCKATTDTDKFTGKIITRTPLECDIDICNFIFTKIIDKADTSFYLEVTLSYRYANYSAKGVYLIFDDDERWVREDHPLSVKYAYSDTYRYWATLKLSKDQVERLRDHKITAAKLYSIEIDVKNPEGFMCAVKKALE